MKPTTKKCPVCTGIMTPVQGRIEQDKIAFDAYKCSKCGEELLDMVQLRNLAHRYRELRKAKEVTFSRWGNSLAVRIPREFTKELHIKEGSHALLKKSRQGLEIAV